MLFGVWYVGLYDPMCQGSNNLQKLIAQFSKTYCMKSINLIKVIKILKRKEQRNVFTQKLNQHFLFLRI